MNNNDNYQQTIHTIGVDKTSYINMSDADWSRLLDKISERNTVLVIGDGLTKVNNISLVEYISSKLLEQVKSYYIEGWRSLGVPEDNYEENLRKVITLPTNGSIMDMNWGDYSDAFLKTKSGDLVQYVKNLIDDLPLETFNYELLYKILSLQKFNIILSTSYSKEYKDIVEKWALDSKRDFYYADIQNDLLMISGAKQGLSWNGSKNQVLFLNLMGHISNKTRSLNHILVTEEDMILFVCSWIAALNKSASNLIEQLKEAFLLVLGCHVPSWAFRFIWYIVKNPTLKKLSESGLQSLCLRPTPWDDNVSKFILRYSTKIIEAEKTITFVDELVERWRSGGYNEQNDKNNCIPPENVNVFISYASEDLDIVEKIIIPIMQSLYEKKRITFWYDKQNLRPSNAWEKEIEYSIKHTCVFLALQTPNSKEMCTNNKIKYLKHEWRCAIKQNERINADNDELHNRFSLILPIIYGDADECVFRYFKDYQYLSINDSNFADLLEQTIQEMIEKNSIYIG